MTEQSKLDEILAELHMIYDKSTPRAKVLLNDLVPAVEAEVQRRIEKIMEGNKNEA